MSGARHSSHLLRYSFRLPSIAALMLGCSAGSSGPMPGAAAESKTATDPTGGSLPGGSTAGTDPGAEPGGLLDPGESTTGLVDEECAAISQQAENQIRPVDIIWALDTSDSMVFELFAVQDNMNVFASQILQQGIDVHVVVIANPGRPDDGDLFNPDPGVCIGPPLATGVCPGGSNPPMYFHDEVGVGSHNALSRFIERYPNYKPTLRQNAVKYFAVVTDDEADGYTADSFAQAVADLDPAYFDFWKFFGIFCTGSCPDFIACAGTGHTYNQLVNMTGGLAGDLCGGNTAGFPPVFDALAQTVIGSATLACDWAIPPAPDGEVFDKNRVNVRYTPSATGTPEDILKVSGPDGCGPEGGWFYDDEASPTRVAVCPSSCQAITSDLAAKMDILFGCETRHVIR